MGGDLNPFSADLIKKRDQQRVSAVHMDAYEILFTGRGEGKCMLMF